MRICSLLPSITEILFSLGLGDNVVAVTHECDWPSEASDKPHVTRSRIHDSALSSFEIDSQVRLHDGSLYELDVDRLASLQPDIILTQSLCPVCAVDERVVRAAATALPGNPSVFSFHPVCLADVRQTIEEIGRRTGADAAARALNDRFDHAIEHIRAELPQRESPSSIVCLEWTNPPFASGHWTPELVELAGGRELLGKPGEHSHTIAWNDLIAADPDVLLVAPCGFSLPRTLEELPWLEAQPGWEALRAVRTGRAFATDGSAYFNRPGPRLIESLNILAEVMYPETFAGLAPRGSIQQLSPELRTKK